MESNHFRRVLWRIFRRWVGLGGCNKRETNSQTHLGITYIKLEEQIPLLGGNLIICTKGQVMDFRALSKIHPLKQNHTQMLVKTVIRPWGPNGFTIQFCFSYLLSVGGCVYPGSYVLTVPERMSWGQQFRRWLLQTRSSVNFTLCRVSSPATIQTRVQLEKPNILQAGSRCQLLWKTWQ